MINALTPIYPLFLISLLSFFVLFTVRRLFMKRTPFVFLYHICLFCVVLVTVVGGGGVQNDGYDRLETFTLLEQNNQLENAKLKPENYDSMLRIDLQQFKNSHEFKEYLQKHDNSVDKAEAMAVGWLFFLVAELSWVLSELCRLIFRRKRK